MKILFDTYPSAFYTPGGGEIQLLKYREELIRLGYDVPLFNQWSPEFGSADLLHYFSCQGGAVHFCGFIKKIGLPLLVSPNLWVTEESKHQYCYADIRQQLSLADQIVCNSDMECNLLGSVFKIPGEKFYTVYNGVDEQFFEPISPEIFRNHFDIHGPFLLNVANIEPRKNQLKLAQVAKEFPDTKLILIGYERDPVYAKQCIEEGGSQIQYLGPLPHNSPLLRSAYAACESFLLPSTLETPGLAALEAMAVGAKVVVTAEGSTREYFGESAFYVDPNDLASISKGIANSLNASNQKLNSFVVRANFTWKHAVKSLEKLYENLNEFTNIVYFDLSKKDSVGFHPVERNSEGLFAWTKEMLDFKMAPGRIRLSWLSRKGALVDVFVDDRLKRTVFVGNNGWQPFELHIRGKDGNKPVSVRLKINVGEKIFGGDPRVLGVAIRDVEIDDGIGF